jgi:hypothetical protein
MKTTRLITVFALLAMASFTSCKKNYVCTCTTVVGPLSTDVKHDIDNATITQANSSCNNYEDEANKSLPGSTDCRL